MAFGIAVDDGSRILTVLNYEEYSPGALEIIDSNGNAYPAEIRSIDGRTGATLLQLDGVKLKTAAMHTGEITPDDTDVTAWGWSDTGIIKSPAILRTQWLKYSTLVYRVDLNSWEIYEKPVGDMALGLPVTGAGDKVIGLIGPLYSGLFPRTLPEEWMVPPVISSDSMQRMLQDDAVMEDGSQPVPVALSHANVVTVYEVLSRDLEPGYAELSEAIGHLLDDCGVAVGPGIEVGEFQDIAWPDPWHIDGKVLTLVFPEPVAVKDLSGIVMADAKWLGLQWDREDDQPDRVFYGTELYLVEGVCDAGDRVGGLVGGLEVIQNELDEWDPGILTEEELEESGIVAVPRSDIVSKVESGSSDSFDIEFLNSGNPYMYRGDFEVTAVPEPDSVSPGN